MKEGIGVRVDFRDKGLKGEAGWKESFHPSFPDASEPTHLMSAGFCGASAGMVTEGSRGPVPLFLSPGLDRCPENLVETSKTAVEFPVF